MKWNGLAASLFPDKAILENLWNIWDEHPYNNSKSASCDCEKPCGSEDQIRPRSECASHSRTRAELFVKECW